MAAFSRKLFSSLFVPLSWTILTIVLLSLPGSAIPGDGFLGFKFEFKHMDKVVHVILFGGIVLFWGLYSIYRIQQHQQVSTKAIILYIVFSIVLGVVMEYVQFYFIPFRSFDKYDIVADSAGAIVAGSFLLMTKRKTGEVKRQT